MKYGYSYDCCGFSLDVCGVIICRLNCTPCKAPCVKEQQDKSIKNMERLLNQLDENEEDDDGDGPIMNEWIGVD